MKQTLNVFGKDVRQFYPEILISLAVVVLFARFYPVQWMDEPMGDRAFQWLGSGIVALVPVSWFVLITRVIQAESLVGERQFWLTRPYQWPKLMAAKALFILAFVYVPFFVAQCVLLREAGMHPLAYLPGIFYNLLMMTGIAVLPMVALATVTSNFAKMLLGLLIVLVYVGGAAYLSTLLPSSSTANSFGEELTFIVPVCLFVAVIVIQYATRRVLLARMLLVALALTTAAFGMFGPEDSAMGMEYPKTAGQTQGVTVEFRPMPVIKSGQAGIYAGLAGEDGVGVEEREFTISFPLKITGVLPETALKADNVRVKITGPNGANWESHWQGLYQTWLPGETQGSVSLKINRAFYERVKDLPVTVEMSLALTALRGGKITRLVLPEKTFMLPGGSVCQRRGVWTNDVTCLSPLRQPPLMLVATKFSTGECSDSAPANDGDSGLGWIGNLDTDPAEFGITSVWTSSVYFRRDFTDRSSKAQSLCAGSPLSYALYTVAGRRQERIVSGPVVLSSFVPKKMDYPMVR